MAKEVDNTKPRFYMGLGIDQRRCAACAVAPTLPCAAHRDHEPCSGAADCPSRLHEHGCYADLAGSTCNDPEDHPSRDQRIEAAEDRAEQVAYEVGRERGL